VLVRVRGVAALRSAFVSLLADPREPVRIEAARALIAIAP
jgi:HEAT repeat protein